MYRSQSLMHAFVSARTSSDAAEPVEPVDRLRREPVAADLVPREAGPVEHERRDAPPGEERGDARSAGPAPATMTS